MTVLSYILGDIIVTAWLLGDRENKGIVEKLGTLQWEHCRLCALWSDREHWGESGNIIVGILWRIWEHYVHSGNIVGRVAKLVQRGNAVEKVNAIYHWVIFIERMGNIGRKWELSSFLTSNPSDVLGNTRPLCLQWRNNNNRLMFIYLTADIRSHAKRRNIKKEGTVSLGFNSHETWRVLTPDNPTRSGNFVPKTYEWTTGPTK